MADHSRDLGQGIGIEDSGLVNAMDWFEKLTGFREAGYEETRAQLEVSGDRLLSRANGASYAIGKLEMVSLNELRKRTRQVGRARRRLRARVVTGDAGFMHGEPSNAQALFQVASQFNLLEMASPDLTPEDGVTRYAYDRTQGPACAIAAGAATLYRNYFVPVAGRLGQTAAIQLDALADLGATLAADMGVNVNRLWSMRNGYAFASESGLDAIARHLVALTAEQRDLFRGRLRIGLHHDVEVTGGPCPQGQLVSQAFCSALPVAYCEFPADKWALFATLVLEAAYEATLRCGVCNAERGASKIVYLTLLGGGAFGNRFAWIRAAIRRALGLMCNHDLDVCLVSYGTPSNDVLAIVDGFQ